MSVQLTLSFSPAATASPAASGTCASDTYSPQKLPLPDADLFYLPGFYTAADSATLLQTLHSETAWRQDTLKFGGKEVAVPRLQAWYGERRYSYSGLQLAPLPWTRVLDSIRHKISAALNLEFNSVLLNYYRNGNDSVAWHSDDERELGPDPQIASLSLGVPRRFELKHRARKASKMNMLLEAGSLLLMGNGVQRHWMHQLPKDAEITAPRLNLTFRFIH